MKKVLFDGKCYSEFDLRATVQKAGNELYESMPEGPLMWLAGELIDLNVDWVLNHPETNGTREILMHGHTRNQRKWLKELKEKLEAEG